MGSTSVTQRGRKIKAERTDKQGAIRKRPVLSLVVLAVAFLAVVAAQWHGKQVVAGFVVNGTTNLSKVAVERVVASFEKVHFGELSFADLRDSLELLPYVSSASVYQYGARTVGVDITERQPIAHVVLQNGDLRFIDVAGTVLPETAGSITYCLPVLRKVDGKLLTPAERARMAGMVVEAHTCLGSPLAEAVSELVLDPTSNSVTAVTDIAVWRFDTSTTDRLRQGLFNMQAFWKTASSDVELARVREFDVRWGRQVVVRYHRGVQRS